MAILLNLLLNIPVRMDISLDDIPGTSSCDEGSYRRLCWDKLNADGRAKYRDVSHDLLSQLIVPDAVNCTDHYHITDTDSFYNEIMQCLIQASDTAFSKHNPIKGSVKPGWSDYVAELYSTSRDVAKLWGNACKPRQGYLFELHRISKARFKLNLRKESLASKLANGDSKGFWKLIKGDSNVRVPLPTSVEGVTGEANIANLMTTHYKDVFNTADEGCRAANYAVCNDVQRIFRFLMMNYLPLLIIWTSISHVALMEYMQSILNLVPMCWLPFSAHVCPVSLPIVLFPTA